VKVAVFSAKPYDRSSLDVANAAHNHELDFLEPRLAEETATLANGYEAVCAFVNDDLSAAVLDRLHAGGVRSIALRSAGFNHVDLERAEELGMAVVRVPAYSPYAVAEHAVGLILTLNRRIHRAYNRVRENNFSLVGLLGFDLHGKTVGVVGTGTIGTVFCRIMRGFGCSIVAYDPYPNDTCRLDIGVDYTDLDTLFAVSDIIALHVPLTPDTHHLVNATTMRKMKEGVMLVNTSRGALVDTIAVIEALKSGHVGALAIDVYEEEGDLFFQDLSGQVVTDDVFSRLLTFPNVLVTGHQAFFTTEALDHIAETTLTNLTNLETGGGEANRVRAL
jgi:D-lactate dehydrogenase